jgi:serine-type D-Ala-D-Ala carboxypeptidase (penicillin-binding protein 5/6)
MSSTRSPRPFSLVVIFCLLISSASALAAAPRSQRSSGPVPPDLYARCAILIEAQTGTVLFEEQADTVVPPASLTKLMTMHLALQEIAAGRLDPDEWVVPPRDAWAKNMPYRSSVMFLGPRQRLSVATLLQGLVVVSGNDAAVAVADLVAGSVPAFVAMMNREAEQLGYSTMHFVEPAGISADNRITAREYADFCRRFIQMHPGALKSFFSPRQFTYPLPENRMDGNGEKPVTQSNTNGLLGSYRGADGLKTGYIVESGYNLAATAEREGMRLISVVLGEPYTAGRVSGATLRVRESGTLLDYGFDNFVTVQPRYDAPAPVRVWKGRARSITLSPRSEPVVALLREKAPGVTAMVERMTDIEAPVHSGQVLGSVVVSLEGRELARFALVADSAVERGGILRRILDSIVMFFGGVSRRIERGPVSSDAVR